jgi:glycosyltransferase involved in cell wall biosynthesis
LQSSARDSPSDDTTLSVILPNYNHGRLIGRAVEAMLSQERPPDEIIIVDDASTDDSLMFIMALAAKSSRISVLPLSVNVGTIAANRKGFDLAKGEYLYFAAADDWVFPGFFELGLRAMKANRDVGLFCGEAVLIDGNTNRIIGYRPAVRPVYRAGVVRPEQSRDLLARMDNWILTGSSIYRREVFESAGGLNVELGSFADGFLSRKISLMSSCYYVPHVVAAWRVFQSGVSRTTALDPVRAQRALELFPATITSDPMFPKWYAALFGKRWRFATARLATLADTINYELIERMIATSGIDRSALHIIRSIPVYSVQRFALLSWLWLRLRPYRLTDLAMTALWRRLARSPKVPDSITHG